MVHAHVTLLGTIVIVVCTALIAMSPKIRDKHAVVPLAIAWYVWFYDCNINTYLYGEIEPLSTNDKDYWPGAGASRKGTPGVG